MQINTDELRSQGYYTKTDFIKKYKVKNRMGEYILEKFSSSTRIMRTGGYGRKTPFYLFDNEQVIHDAICSLKNDIFLNIILPKECSKVLNYLISKGFIYINTDDGGKIFCHINYPDNYFNLEHHEFNRYVLYDKFWCKVKIDTALNSAKRKQKISKLLGI